MNNNQPSFGRKLGNTFPVTLYLHTVVLEGTLEDHDVAVSLYNETKGVRVQVPCDVAGNTVKFSFTAALQKACGGIGLYTPCILVDAGDDNLGEADWYKSIEIVAHSSQEYTRRNAGVNVGPIVLDGDMTLIANGLSAYEIWKAAGHQGSISDFITYLRQPALDAAAAVAAEEALRAAAERARATAEGGRSVAEAARASAEALRASAEETRQAAEEARKAAEVLRAAAEGTRNSEEAQRIDAEAARVIAEAGRAAAESDRVVAELSRVAKEAERVQAETGRGTAEEARATAESSRVAAEAARATAEAARVSAENARVAAESARVAAEASRAAAENARDAAETARNTAEAGRSSAETTRQTNEQTRQSQESARETACQAAVAAANAAAAAAHAVVEDATAIRAAADEALAAATAATAAAQDLAGAVADVAALRDDVDELLLGSHDHMAAAWAKEQLSPTAVKKAGDPGLVNFDFYLIDHTRNTGDHSAPIGRLKRNNILRFEDGSFAPVVGITAAMAAECMGNDLYLNGELYAATGAFDAAAFYADHCTWEAGLDGVVKLQHPTLLKGSANGDEVTHYLMPWETTSTNYSVMLGHAHKLYYLQNVEGTNGRVWNFITTEPRSWDGLDPVSVKPSAFSPSPAAVILDGATRKSRSFFYAYDGLAAAYGDGSVGDSGGLVSMFKNTGRTFPATSIMSQVTSMQYARNNNADPTKSYPFAEGGWALYNLFVTWLEIKYGTRALAAASRFASGISSNDACASEANFLANGGVRARVQGTENWEYRRWDQAPSIIKKNAGGDAPSAWSSFMNNYHAKEACMESQIAASIAVEAGVAEGVQFEAYGETYSWSGVPGTDNLEHGHMNAIIRSVRKGTVAAYNANGEATTFEVEASLRMSLFEGANLSGDIYRYWGGGFEIIGNCISTVSGHTGDPVDFFFEPDQEKWVADTDYSHANGAPFLAEGVYEKLGSSKVLGNNYSLADFPMTPWRIKSGGGISQGMCHYGYDTNYWGTTIGARVRVGVRFAGYAHYGFCAPRYLFAYTAAGYTNTYFGGSAQVVIGEGAAAPQAQ